MFALVSRLVLASSLLVGGAAATESTSDGAPASGERGNATSRPPHLVRQVGNDFKSVFTTKQNLLIVGLGGAAALAAHPWDDELATGTFNSEVSGNSDLDAVFEAGQIVGGGLVQVGGAFVLYGAGKLFTKPGAENLGRDLVRSQIVTQSLTFALKLSVGRERPEDPTNKRSFPSGHSSGTFATATVLHRHYGWKVGAPSYAVAAYVATSRMNEARHYLSDVVFGAAVGIMGGSTVTRGLDDSGFAIVPAPVNGGVGLRLTWNPRPARP